MRPLRHITLLLATTLLLWGCNKEETLLEDQTSKLEKFVTSTLGLVSEEEALAEGEDRQREFYTKLGSTVYRYITNYYDENRREGHIIRNGSLVQLTLSLYDFSSMKRIGEKELPAYTNDAAKIALLEEAGLNTTYWSDEPYYVRVGESQTFEGLAISLEGCYEGDEVELYMTYPMAYGGDYLYTIAPQSPVALFFRVDVVFDE